MLYIFVAMREILNQFNINTKLSNNHVKFEHGQYLEVNLKYTIHQDV